MASSNLPRRIIKVQFNPSLSPKKVDVVLAFRGK
ncbi:hypothetical protein CCACVL1_15693 [Corchorus capsularis]|uniref:Uncharacterized protein n=1 Tax=Corchorus capsularis TaxID=210143 RepID=A0A1R3I1C0_COCAP|nr:hypothetical protein CCACVL1_15693 [Corchorus capsularis]